MNGETTSPTTSPEKVKRRREQLRKGQRAHRERKNRRIEDLEARVKGMEVTISTLENELRSARACTPEARSCMCASIGNISEDVTMPLSASVFPLDHAERSEAYDAELYSTDRRSFRSNLVAQKMPAVPLTDFLPLHQRLQYRTVQRTLEYTLTYDLASLNRVFMFHLQDPSMRHSYRHPEVGVVQKLLATVVVRGEFAFQWPLVIIPSAEEALAKQGLYMDARQVESYVASFQEAYPLCLSLRADEFIAELSRLAVCFGWHGPCFAIDDVVRCARRVSQ